MDAKCVDWLWRQAVDACNSNVDHSLNKTLFAYNELHSREIQKLDPYYREGYTVTIKK